jgi:hypothetical protein
MKIINACQALIAGEMRSNVAITIQENIITEIGEAVDNPDDVVDGTLIPGRNRKGNCNSPITRNHFPCREFGDGAN